jgi:hypothetical protein
VKISTDLQIIAGPIVPSEDDGLIVDGFVEESTLQVQPSTEFSFLMSAPTFQTAPTVKDVSSTEVGFNCYYFSRN